MPNARAIRAILIHAIGLWLLLFSASAEVAAADPPRNPLASFDLPDDWEARFWASPSMKALLALDDKALANLVPVQAGLRYCRCPGCDASEADDPLSWSVEKPKLLTCRRCGIAVPNDEYPAKVEKKVPEETIEVLPRVIHHYPYHVVEPEKQRYPEERLYLDAKRDYEAREFLAKVALYAAVRYHEQPLDGKDSRLARLACVLLVRFAQVYPAYAMHFDQPGQPKFFQQANLPPPYRIGYRTGKWDWTASLDVPLNLVIAYAMLRDDPALIEAGRELGDPNPARTVEVRLFRASADFVRRQQEDSSESALRADRGVLAVGRLLNDSGLVKDAESRLRATAERGFYHDGFWRQGDATAHRRVLGLIDGWIAGLMASTAGAPALPELPILALAHAASSSVLPVAGPAEVQQASWPAPAAGAGASTRQPLLLGGAGLARLAVGEGDQALDLELLGPDNLGAPHFQRQALRVAVGGRPMLADLDDFPPLVTGWDRATASHNTVVVNGLNQRETLERAAEPASGGSFLFFAADPDFQVAALDDPRAYPRSTRRYRQTIVAASGARFAYAIGVFEVRGGLQHDQLFHAPAGSPARWQISEPLTQPPTTLLPTTTPYVATARAEDGRWFVQAYGEFTPLGQATFTRPSQAKLAGPDGRGVRLHLLSDCPLTVFTATGPDPTVSTPRAPGDEAGRAALILRHTSSRGPEMTSTFVTVYEPLTATPTLKRVGRVAAPEGTVVLYLETIDGPEQIVFNLSPGTVQTVPLADGQRLTTDGRVVRVAGRKLTLAGGTFAELAGRQVRQTVATGKIVGAIRRPSTASRGWFESDTPLADLSTLAGRVLLIRHGDGVTRGWTLQRVENNEHGARLFVREEPGWLFDPKTQEARYYQFPGITLPGPHQFVISKIAR